MHSAETKQMDSNLPTSFKEVEVHDSQVIIFLPCSKTFKVGRSGPSCTYIQITFVALKSLCNLTFQCRYLNISLMN